MGLDMYLTGEKFVMNTCGQECAGGRLSSALKDSPPAGAERRSQRPFRQERRRSMFLGSVRSSYTSTAPFACNTQWDFIFRFVRRPLVAPKDKLSARRAVRESCQLGMIFNSA
jgi:hypothetical protein